MSFRRFARDERPAVAVAAGDDGGSKAYRAVLLALGVVVAGLALGALVLDALAASGFGAAACDDGRPCTVDRYVPGSGGSACEFYQAREGARCAQPACFRGGAGTLAQCRRGECIADDARACLGYCSYMLSAECDFPFEFDPVLTTPSALLSGVPLVWDNRSYCSAHMCGGTTIDVSFSGEVTGVRNMTSTFAPMGINTDCLMLLSESFRHAHGSCITARAQLLDQNLTQAAVRNTLGVDMPAVFRLCSFSWACSPYNKTAIVELFQAPYPYDNCTDRPTCATAAAAAADPEPVVLRSLMTEAVARIVAWRRAHGYPVPPTA
jgi:hypothetical protein